MYRFRVLLLVLLIVAIPFSLAVSGVWPLPVLKNWLGRNQLPQKMPDYITQIGHLVSPQQQEISGIVRSQQYPDIFWVINDSGNSPTVYGVNQAGETLAKIRVNTTNIDWEDLALVEQHGRYWLVIADIGDNRAVRKAVRLIWLEEPSPEVSTAEVAYLQTFQYPGGPRDSESIAYDAALKQMLILSKRRVPAEAFTLSIPDKSAVNSESELAVKVAELSRLPQPDNEARQHSLGAYSSQPTAMDIQYDKLIVMTYRHAYIYKRQAGQGFETVLTEAPEKLPLYLLAQQEAVAWYDQNSFVYVSEGEASPVLRVHIPDDLNGTASD